MVKEPTMAGTKQSKSVPPSVRRKADGPKPKPPLDRMPIQQVWKEYQASREEPARCEVVRNFLMEKFLPLVRYNAERIYTRLPDEVDIEDLMSAGLFGLMDAIDAFDLAKRDSSAVSTHSIPRKFASSDGGRELREIDVVRDDGESNPLREIQR